MFALLLYMNSRNEKVGRVLFRLNEIKESMKFFFLKKMAPGKKAFRVDCY